MSSSEDAVSFRVLGDRLLGVLHNSAQPAPQGVLLIVGGPQYRVGGHRQFVLLARHLAAAGVPVLRFDYRGMGDSEGPTVGFDGAEADIAAALDEFFRRVPALREVALWGLCDAASAALMYAFRDRRVTGLVLLNPWVRQVQSEARTHLRHYYLRRLVDGEMLKKLATGRLNVLRSGRELAETLLASVAGRVNPEAPPGSIRASFVARMLDGFERFEGRTLLILSGDDLTAAEFKDETARSREWRRALARDTVTRHELAEANHTFSTRAWRDVVATWTLNWLRAS
jgi:exosortase A-associated hydrolase 1